MSEKRDNNQTSTGITWSEKSHHDLEKLVLSDSVIQRLMFIRGWTRFITSTHTNKAGLTMVSFSAENDSPDESKVLAKMPEECERSIEEIANMVIHAARKKLTTPAGLVQLQDIVPHAASAEITANEENREHIDRALESTHKTFGGNYDYALVFERAGIDTTGHTTVTITVGKPQKWQVYQEKEVTEESLQFLQMDTEEAQGAIATALEGKQVAAWVATDDVSGEN